MANVLYDLTERRKRMLIARGGQCAECLHPFSSPEDAVLLDGDVLAHALYCEWGARAHIAKRPDLHNDPEPPRAA